MNNGLNIIGQSDVVVHLACQYPNVISLSSTFGFAHQTTFKLGPVRLKAIYLDQALLNPSSQIYKDTVALLVKLTLDDWVGEPKPTSITFKSFTISGGRRRRRVVANEKILMAEIEMTYVTGKAADNEKMLRLTLKALLAADIVLHTDNDLDSLAIAATTVNVNGYHEATVQGDGNLAAGFDFDIFDDDTYQTELTQMILGRSLFAKIEWSLVVSAMSFYVETCTYSCGTNPLSAVKIIKVSQYRLIGFIFFILFLGYLLFGHTTSHPYQFK